MIDELIVKRIPNFPVDSNCYLITRESSPTCIMVDPACGDGSPLRSCLETNSLKLEYIILTHEHFDHISSMEYLRRVYNCKVVSSASCSSNICNRKKNLSIFYDQVGFSCSPVDIVISQSNCFLQWQNSKVEFYLTPGHSEGGICFRIGNSLFTGDTLLKKYNTIVKLPGGNKKQLSQSLAIIKAIVNKDMTIFPGHGESFKISELELVNVNELWML